VVFDEKPLGPDQVNVAGNANPPVFATAAPVELFGHKVVVVATLTVKGEVEEGTIVTQALDSHPLASVAFTQYSPTGKFSIATSVEVNPLSPDQMTLTGSAAPLNVAAADPVELAAHVVGVEEMLTLNAAAPGSDTSAQAVVTHPAPSVTSKQ
jgi:hypothetical protein